MSETAADTSTKARRWNAFVCPGCRLLFRVPKEHGGAGVVCPSCRRLLKLPGSGDDVPALVSEAFSAGLSSRSVAELSAEHAAGDEGHRHHGHARMSLWASLWRGTFGSGRDNQSRWVILCVGVLVAFLGIFGMIRLIGGGVKHPGDGGESRVESDLPPAVVDDPAIESSVLIEPATFQLKAEPLARRLMEARSVSEMLPLVRDPELTAPRMRDWYGRHGFDGLEINRFAYRNETSFIGSMASVLIMMSDFIKREMVFVADGDTLLIDWESWVGWSELPWSEFMEKRPASPKLFRVKAQLGNYFNYGFKEHSNWRCYEFESPDGEHLLFAYGEIGSEADNKLAGVEERDKRALTVRLRYPENAPTANQVIIDEVLADGWVVLDEQSGAGE